MPSIFFGSKISGLCIFLGLQYEAPSDPPVMYTSSAPPPPGCLIGSFVISGYNRSQRSRCVLAHILKTKLPEYFFTKSNQMVSELEGY